MRISVLLFFIFVLISLQQRNDLEITNPLVDACDLTSQGIRCCNSVCELIELSRIPICEVKTMNHQTIKECCNIKKLNDNIIIKANCFTITKLDEHVELKI
jgi:hypothetical protein